MERKRIIIIGNRGFIGQALEAYIRKTQKDIEIIGLGRQDMDLTNEIESAALSDYLNKETLVVFVSGIKRNARDSAQLFNQNVAMAVNCYNVFKSAPIKRLIYISSTAVYGEDTRHPLITEHTLVNPMSFYGMSKYISENILRKSLEGKPKCDFLALRLPTIYGSNDQAGTYGPVQFLNAVDNKEPITLWGDGKELREFVHIQDLVEIVSRLTFSNVFGVFNITSGMSVSFMDIIMTYRELGLKAVQISSRPRTKEKVDHVFDNTLLLSSLGSFEFTSLAKGLSDLIQSKGRK